ncbi:unnamed protein product [Onchocerca flexuosa]|uniref:G_PROTEIN_RECEP_F1_2 domain-containing protein n=1 Tax=Onchocerca flexuosa TaxID=387005 RepID=A0A183HQ83_9BILA|nr:unnamed protein product [Onchocerca flexuosa]
MIMLFVYRQSDVRRAPINVAVDTIFSNVCLLNIINVYEAFLIVIIIHL